ncbi:ATP-binding protein [Sphingomonas sp. 28-63-12]|uniref:sensor histidine kinase n=1 Tax=Sphingomonas sp. 28-63-12 TaxID=1970434 RepID=UPI0035A89457
MLIGSLAVGFASLIAAALAAAWFTQRSQEYGATVNHTYQVEQAIAAFRVPLWRAEAARRGYIITPNPAILAVYRDMDRQLVPALDRLHRLTGDNPHQRRRIARLRVLTTTLTTMREQSISTMAAGKASAAARAAWINESVPILLEVGRLNNAMNLEEQQLLRVRDARERASLQLFYIVLSIAGILVVIVAALTVATVLRYTNDLTTSRDRLRDLADGLEESVRDRTAELSRVNEEIQRFAYIVSHDLRAPLVNVLGFTAELETAGGALGSLVDLVEATAPHLLSDDARRAVREDLPEAIGFIRSSTQKMDRLINAILKLAREGRRGIMPETLDLNAMVADIAGSLQHQLDTLAAVIEVPGDLPTMVSDRIAVEQMLSNLIENAVKYLQPGRPGRITVTSRQAGDQIILTIADNGRGIDPRDHQRIFDLFRRSGVQDQPGEGIGLAHVRALAYRLGGRIDVESILGEGATFRLTLPKISTEIRDA